MTPETLASLLIPLAVTAAGAAMLSKKKNYFDVFVAGARDGLKNSVNLLPTLLALTVALSMLSASGADKLLADVLKPVGDATGVPTELLPLLLTRSVSGGASGAAYLDLIGRVGADSLPGLCASVIMGSSDTLLYVVSVYFSAAPRRTTRHTLPVCVVVMLVCIYVSCAVCRAFFPQGV